MFSAPMRRYLESDDVFERPVEDAAQIYAILCAALDRGRAKSMRKSKIRLVLRMNQ